MNSAGATLAVAFAHDEDGAAPTGPPSGDGWLSLEERAAESALRFEPRRRDWRLGRWVAKQAVATILGRAAPPDDLISVLAAPDGAPDVRLDGEPAPLVISITHRSGSAACLLAPMGAMVGCDLEVVERRDGAFVRDYLTQDEQEWVGSLPVEVRPLAVTLAWSAKESAFKATREGLRADTRWMPVVVDPFPAPPATGRDRPTGWSPLRVTDVRSGRVFHGWWLTVAAYVLTAIVEPAAEAPCLFRVHARPHRGR